MTANITIPVSSADNVLAVPLAAVFTDRDPETGVSQRYVYVQGQEGSYERRPVQVGVSDLFFAEIQDGLQPGETVLLEQPKEEREEKNKPMQQARNKGSATNSPAGAVQRISPAKNT
jgi:hypothetical protein